MSKLIFIGDVHLGEKAPRSRGGDWLEIQASKLDFLNSFSMEHDAEIFCAGDLFDTVRNSNYYYAWLMKWIPFMKVVPGNHDLPGNNMKFIESSPLNVLAAAGKIEIFSEAKFFPKYYTTIYPIPWKGEIQEAQKESKRLKDINNIAIMHAPVYENQPPPWHQTAFSAKEIRKMYPDMDLIVCSDIHTPFVDSKQKPVILNTGPIMRTDYGEHKLHSLIWLYDTETQELSSHQIDVEAEWTTEALEQEHEHTERMEKFVDKFDADIDVSIDYDIVLANIIKQNDVKEEVKEEIDDVIKTVGG